MSAHRFSFCEMAVKSISCLMIGQFHESGPFLYASDLLIKTIIVWPIIHCQPYEISHEVWNTLRIMYFDNIIWFGKLFFHDMAAYKVSVVTSAPPSVNVLDMAIRPYIVYKAISLKYIYFLPYEMSNEVWNTLRIIFQ